MCTTFKEVFIRIMEEGVNASRLHDFILSDDRSIQNCTRFQLVAKNLFQVKSNYIRRNKLHFAHLNHFYVSYWAFQFRWKGLTSPYMSWSVNNDAGSDVVSGDPGLI